jgi:hypothetical protein
MKLFWLKTRFTWIGSLSEFSDIHRDAKIIKRVKPEVRKLCTHLLHIGGERVVLPFNEPTMFFETLINVGQVTSYKKLSIKNGEERECHRNSAQLWVNNKRKYNIVTGFGLSDDNIWRRHSWLVAMNGDLIETTIAREMYFGILLNNEIAGTFADFYLG